MALQDLYTIVGRKVKYYRELKGFSQLQLSEQAQINRATISNIESGKQQTSLHLLYKIGSVLGTEVSFFLPTLNEIVYEPSSLEDKIKEQDIDNDTKMLILNLLNKGSKND